MVPCPEALLSARGRVHGRSLSAHRGRTDLYQEARAPSRYELKDLLDQSITRLVRLLTRKGYLVEEEAMSHLADIDADEASRRLLASSTGKFATIRSNAI